MSLNTILHAPKHHSSPLEEHRKTANCSQAHGKVLGMRENLEHSPVYVHLASQHTQDQGQAKCIKAALFSMPCYYRTGPQALRMLSSSIVTHL